MKPRPILAVFATLDPRGGKIGGIETHIRHILRNHPPECDLVLIGIDEFGDLPVGKPVDVNFSGREITFLPVAHIPADEARISAARLFRSTTLRFVLGGLRHLGAIRALFSGRSVSADLPRVEFAILPAILGIPYVLTIHSDLTKTGKTDSLLKRYGAVKAWSEGFAFRAAQQVFAVNDAICQTLLAEYPRLAGHCEVLPVPVDTRLFTPTPFPSTDVFQLVYAGRFDEVKDPALMFRAVAALAKRLDGKIRFHVIGSADPSRFAEFEAIRSCAEIHGPRNAEGVAAIVKSAHAAIMTSHSEGLPCFLLETFASGRTFGAIRLPSFEPFVIPGKTGRLVDRAETVEETATTLADAFVALRDEIASGALDPRRIADSVAALSVTSIFTRLFTIHAEIRAPRDGNHHAVMPRASHA